MQRVVTGWKEACHPETGLIPQLQSLKSLWKTITKGGVPSWLLSMPDPNLALDVYQGVVNSAYNSNVMDEKTFAKANTESEDSMKEEDDGTFSVDTKIKIGAGLDNEGLATTLAGGTIGEKEAALLGQFADCAVAGATAVATGGMTAGGAVGGCGKFLAGGIKYAMDKYIANTEHKTTRQPCDSLKAEVYHIGEYSGRAMDLFTTLHAEKQELYKFGMVKGSMEQGMVIFNQMQCMTNVALNYVKMPGELLGINSDAAKLTCGGGSDLDTDEKYAEEALQKMTHKYTAWKSSTGVAAAIARKKQAEKDAVVEKAEKARTGDQKAVLDEILENTRTIVHKWDVLKDK